MVWRSIQMRKGFRLVYLLRILFRTRRYVKAFQPEPASK
jgi:hypothetical protein